jgi:hypothetical protein
VYKLPKILLYILNTFALVWGWLGGVWNFFLLPLGDYNIFFPVTQLIAGSLAFINYFVIYKIGKGNNASLAISLYVLLAILLLICSPLIVSMEK